MKAPARGRSAISSTSPLFAESAPACAAAAQYEEIHVVAIGARERRAEIRGLRCAKAGMRGFESAQRVVAAAQIEPAGALALLARSLARRSPRCDSRRLAADTRRMRSRSRSRSAARGFPASTRAASRRASSRRGARREPAPGRRRSRTSRRPIPPARPQRRPPPGASWSSRSRSRRRARTRPPQPSRFSNPPP